MALSEGLLIQVRGGVAQVVLARPDRDNRLDLAMAADFAAKVRDWSADPAVRAFILHGALRGRNEPLFCGGLDLVEMADPARASELVAALWDLLAALRGWTVPKVAFIDGAAAGSGLGLALSLDHVVVSERARLNVLENGVGPAIGAGVAWILSHIGDGAGTMTALVGSAIGPAEALHLGLATHHVRAEQVQQLVSTLYGAELGEDAGGVVGGLVADFSEVLPPPALRATHGVVDVAGVQPSLPLLLASLHLVNSQWSLAAAAAIRARSPIGQMVNHRLLGILADLDAVAAQAVERDVFERLLAHPDTASGLARARGDEAGAAWSPGRIEQVREDDVRAILVPRADQSAAVGAKA